MWYEVRNFLTTLCIYNYENWEIWYCAILCNFDPSMKFYNFWGIEVWTIISSKIISIFFSKINFPHLLSWIWSSINSWNNFSKNQISISQWRSQILSSNFQISKTSLSDPQWTIWFWIQILPKKTKFSKIYIFILLHMNKNS